MALVRDGRYRHRLAAGLASLWMGAGASAQQAGPCSALLEADFRSLPDAPTTLERAEEVPAADGLPAHCRVRGRIPPEVNFELQVPVAGTWNGKFLMQGCGGLCGAARPETAEDALARAYAVVTTDMGHVGEPWEAAWAHDNLEAEIDFAYRATHVVAVAAKAIIATYHGRGPQQSYFRGCSTGGRQGLIAAQRFPADFDGIIAGAPVFDETGIAALHLIWSGRANLDDSGRPLLAPADVEHLHRSVLGACDADDGMMDGIIEDPRRCRFDPGQLACGAADPQPGCFSAEQVAAARRLYDGAADSAGRRLTPGGLAPGSERDWVPAFVGRDGPAVFHPAGPVRDLYQYLIFLPDPGPVASASVFDFDWDPPRLALMETLYSAGNPDLRGFRDRGGKLILYHGWNDVEIPPAHMLDYFSLMQQAMGGAEQAASFTRLYMMPGVAHCRRGPGADTVDWLGYLEQWVEAGKAPEEVTAYHPRREQNYLGLPRPRFPLPAADYDRIKRLYPYPRTAGQGAGQIPASAGDSRPGDGG